MCVCVCDERIRAKLISPGQENVGYILNGSLSIFVTSLLGICFKILVFRVEGPLYYKYYLVKGISWGMPPPHSQ